MRYGARHPAEPVPGACLGVVCAERIGIFLSDTVKKPTLPLRAATYLVSLVAVITVGDGAVAAACLKSAPGKVVRDDLVRPAPAE